MKPAQQERIQSLCSEFRLPTIGAEVVRRFQADQQGQALETLLAVFELEASDRHERRVARLRRASKLPIGKTWESFDRSRLPAKLQDSAPRVVETSQAVPCQPVRPVPSETRASSCFCFERPTSS